MQATGNYFYIALVMVSAFASEREEQAARELGIQAFLPKPITRAED